MPLAQAQCADVAEEVGERGIRTSTAVSKISMTSLRLGIEAMLPGLADFCST